MEITARLEDWYVNGDSLVGTIYNDNKGRFADGTTFQTSSVTSQNSKICRTRNSTYELGRRVNKGHGG